MSEERKVHPTDASKVKPGDVMAVIHWVKVQSISPDANQMTVSALDGNTTNTATPMIEVRGRELITKAASADYYQEEIKATMTDVAEKLVTSHNRPFTVCFTKQPKKGEEEGEERILRGRLIAAEPLLGRSQVEDLDQPEGDRFRLVDHRTVKFLIVDGVKYTVVKRVR